MTNKKTVTVTGELDYVEGRVESGYFTLDLTQEEYEKFKNLTESKQESYLHKEGTVGISDFSVDGYGEIYKITSSED